MTVTDRHPFFLEVAKALVATVIATVSATWTARGMLADYDRRISVIEARQQYSDANVSAALMEIRSDLREVRAAVTGSRGRE